jgi:hypothetical protein
MTDSFVVAMETLQTVGLLETHCLRNHCEKSKLYKPCLNSDIYVNKKQNYTYSADIYINGRLVGETDLDWSSTSVKGDFNHMCSHFLMKIQSCGTCIVFIFLSV